MKILYFKIFKNLLEIGLTLQAEKLKPRDVLCRFLPM